MNYNYVEEKVDTFMIDKLENKYPGVKSKVTKASKSSKRLAIASILGDPKTFELIKKTLNLQKSDEYLTNLDELVVLFRKYVGVADVEKKTLGEVMTPIPLVEDMLDTLPNEVWSNPNKKWFDPCAGVGTFPSIVIQRLMKGLENVIPNPEKRYGHIIENMIYVCELQEKNLFVFNCVFDLGDNNATNSYCGSFLDENFDKHMSDVWGVEKFDIIIGNPPYQTQKEGNTKTHPLWHLFVEKSISILCEGGYLNMVHPSNWRYIDGSFRNIFDMFKNKEMLYLELHSKSDGNKVFGASTTFDFYCLKNNKNNSNLTKIKFQDGVIGYYDLSKLKFIPNGKMDMFVELMANDNEDKVNVLYNRSSYGTDKKNMSLNQTNEFKYPCIYYTYSNGTYKLWYSSTKDNGHFNIPKVIFSSGISTPLVDVKGEFGQCQFAYGIIDSVDCLEDIKIALLNDKFLELMKYVDGVSGQRYNYKILSTFRKDFYKQFLND